MSLLEKFSHCVSEINWNSYYAILRKMGMLHWRSWLHLITTSNCSYFLRHIQTWVYELHLTYHHIIHWLQSKSSLFTSSLKFHQVLIRTSYSNIYILVEIYKTSFVKIMIWPQSYHHHYVFKFSNEPSTTSIQLSDCQNIHAHFEKLMFFNYYQNNSIFHLRRQAFLTISQNKIFDL